MTPEGKVKKKVLAIANEYECWHCTPATWGYGRSGVPDILICVEGRLLTVECKAGSNKPTRLQLIEANAIMRAGGVALVINEDNIEDVRKEIEHIIRDANNRV